MMRKSLARLLCGLCCGLGLVSSVAAQAFYEIVEQHEDSKLEAVLAQFKGGVKPADCPQGGSVLGCALRDGTLVDYGRLAGLEFALPLISHAQGGVAGYGVAGGLRGFIDGLYRWYFRNFVITVPDHFLRYQYPLRTAFVHDGKTLQRVTGLGGTDTTVTAINAAGEVVGRSETRTGAFHAYVHRGGRSLDLGTLGGGSSWAYGLNDRGEVVGKSTNAAGDEHAFLHRDGRLHA